MRCTAVPLLDRIYVLHCFSECCMHSPDSCSSCPFPWSASKNLQLFLCMTTFLLAFLPPGLSFCPSDRTHQPPFRVLLWHPIHAICSFWIDWTGPISRSGTFPPFSRGFPPIDDEMRGKREAEARATRFSRSWWSTNTRWTRRKACVEGRKGRRSKLEARGRSSSFPSTTVEESNGCTSKENPADV